MVIYNYCSRCGKRIKIDERDPILSLSLQNTEKAICSDCDKDSKWTPVYSYEVVGRDGEIFIERKIDGWTITGVMMGVNHRVPNLVIERLGMHPIILSYGELIDMYEKKLSLDLYTKIPQKIREHVFLAICDILKAFRLEITRL